ncbi:MAG TPA: hypothetical protein VFC25_00275 [Verrucomicrobiae bacterium]|nr:hypothetical protein [Verrucomicrobiae bacterium]
MRRLLVLLMTVGALVAAPRAAVPAESRRSIETLVFVRHGEKPKDGLGLLTCRGAQLTIGPTAVRMGVPVNTQLPYNDRPERDARKPEVRCEVREPRAAARNLPAVTREVTP